MTFDPAAASLCLRLCRIAYKANPEKHLDRIGVTFLAGYDRAGTLAFLAEHRGILFLAGAGTNEFKDIGTDIYYRKTDFPGGGRVHEGFLDAFKAIRDDISRDLIHFKKKPKIATGHSLFGTIAQEAAVDFNFDACYVFGSPKVGNKDFVARLTMPVFRFENRLDPVTWVPPMNSPWQAFHALRCGRAPTLYRHGGTTIKLAGWRHYLSKYERSVPEYLAALRDITPG